MSPNSEERSETFRKVLIGKETHSDKMSEIFRKKIEFKRMPKFQKYVRDI